MMGFVEAVKTCYRKSFDVSGCASRSEFWWFVLFYFASILCLGIISLAIGLLFYSISGASPGDIGGESFVVLCFIFIICSIPAVICLQVRRLHDSNHSAWNLLWALIPYLGAIVLLLMYVANSDPDSKYSDRNFWKRVKGF